MKIPVDWIDSSKTERLGADAVLLLVTALGHSARQTSDGIVAQDQLRKLWPVADLEDCLARLIDAGELEERADDCFLLVNWRRFILQADEVERIREQNQIRDRRRRRHQKGDHGECLPKYCSHAREVAADSRETHVSAGVSRGDPIRPAPTRPAPKGAGKGRCPCGSGKPLAVDGERCDECVGAALLAAPSAASPAKEQAS